MKSVLRLPNLAAVLAPVLAAAIALLAAGCGGSGGPSQSRLTVYSPHGPEMMGFFERAFEAEHPGIDVRVIEAGSQDLLARIRGERANPACDVWWGAPWYMFDQAARDGLLEPYAPTWVDKVDAIARDRQNRWVGTFYMPQVILYNRDMITRDEAPKSWAELTEPRWKNRIIVRYPPPSGTMRTIFGALALYHSADGDLAPGYAYLARLDRNTKEYASDPVLLFDKITRQEGSISLWNVTDAVLQARLNMRPFDYVVPEEGTPILVDGIALIKGRPNPEWAEKFYEFVTSRTNLILAAEKFDRFPTRTDIAHEDLPDWMAEFLRNVHWMDVDWSLLAQKEKEILEHWEQHIKGQGQKYLEKHSADAARP